MYSAKGKKSVVIILILGFLFFLSCSFFCSFLHNHSEDHEDHENCLACAWAITAYAVQVQILCIFVCLSVILYAILTAQKDPVENIPINILPRSPPVV